MQKILSDWSKDTSVTNRTIYKLLTNYQSDVELTFKIANSIPSYFLVGFGETGTGSQSYWAKAMFYNENKKLLLFSDNTGINFSSNISTNTVLKLTTKNLHTVKVYVDDILKLTRNTNSSRGLNLRIDSYTASPIILEYLKIKAL